MNVATSLRTKAKTQLLPPVPVKTDITVTNTSQITMYLYQPTEASLSGLNFAWWTRERKILCFEGKVYASVPKRCLNKGEVWDASRAVINQRLLTIRVFVQDFPKCEYSSWIEYLSPQTLKVGHMANFQESTPRWPSHSGTDTSPFSSHVPLACWHPTWYRQALFWLSPHWTASSTHPGSHRL